MARTKFERGSHMFLIIDRNLITDLRKKVFNFSLSSFRFSSLKFSKCLKNTFFNFTFQINDNIKKLHQKKVETTPHKSKSNTVSNFSENSLEILFLNTFILRFGCATNAFPIIGGANGPGSCHDNL